MKRFRKYVPHLESLETRDLPAVSFAPAALVPAERAAAVAVADFNGDHVPDLATVPLTGNSSVSVLLGKGGGQFGFARSFSLPSGYAHAVAAGDFNNDGRLDLAVASDAKDIGAGF